MKIRVLFLCATNGVHSPMAEALLRRIDSTHFEVASAGIESEHMHPLTVEVMKEVQIDLEKTEPISVRSVFGREFDFVITMCDCAHLSRFPQAEHVRWRFEDPAATLGEEKQRRAFQTVRDQIAQRINLFTLVQANARVDASDSSQISHVRREVISVQ